MAPDLMHMISKQWEDGLLLFLDGNGDGMITEQASDSIISVAEVQGSGLWSTESRSLHFC